MQTRMLLIGAVILSIYGCSTGRFLEATHGPISARALPVGPPTWQYDVQTNGVAPITSLGFVTQADLSKCTFRMEPDGPEIRAAKDEKGLTFHLPEINRRQVQFTIRCPEAENGTIQIVVIDDARVARTVGPLAGPR